MPATQSSRQVSMWDALPAVSAPMGYLGAVDGPMQVRIYPPSSGLATVRPLSVKHTMSIRDARSITDRLRLDEQGFELHSHRSAFGDFYDEAAVRERYYREVQSVMRSLTGAAAVIVFDHNVRSAARAARGELGVRVPVDQVHNDYTEQSGPKRKREILEAARRPIWAIGMSLSSTYGVPSSGQCSTTRLRCARQPAWHLATSSQPISFTLARTICSALATAARSIRFATTPHIDGFISPRCGPTRFCC